MVLDSKFRALEEHFGIERPEDWCRVMPEWITALPDIGPQTLAQLRLYLANRGLTLKDDKTPAEWQAELDVLRGATQIAPSERKLVTPFVVLIDKAEQHPFTFAGFRGDAREGNRPLVVQTRFEHLGPSHGDYTVEGLERYCHIERKSREDVQSTVLGWGDRREQFMRTLEFLSELPSAAIVVECTRGEALLTMHSRGKKSKAENQKIFQRQVAAWEDDYRVPWKFCDNRRLAEIECFQQLKRQWRHVQAERKRAEREAREWQAKAEQSAQMFSEML